MEKFVGRMISKFLHKYCTGQVLCQDDTQVEKRKLHFVSKQPRLAVRLPIIFNVIATINFFIYLFTIYI